MEMDWSMEWTEILMETHIGIITVPNKDITIGMRLIPLKMELPIMMEMGYRIE